MSDSAIGIDSEISSGGEELTMSLVILIQLQRRWSQTSNDRVY
jgi:hypothetical protein